MITTITELVLCTCPLIEQQLHHCHLVPTTIHIFSNQPFTDIFIKSLICLPLRYLVDFHLPILSLTHPSNHRCQVSHLFSLTHPLDYCVGEL